MARRPQARKAPGRAWTRGNVSGDVLKLAVGGLIVAVLAMLLQMAWPDGFPLVPRNDAANVQGVEWINEIYTQGPVRINEVMSANRSSYVAEDGSTPDWIEISNVSDGEVDLAGYALAKSADGANVFTFPSLQLAPGESVLVLADSRLRQQAGEALHAPFRLSSQGDVLMLFNPSGAAIDTVNIPALSGDTSYARMAVESWQVSATPTPGQPNTEAGYLALTQPSGNSPVVITELMADNVSVCADGEGRYFDYIELYNRSGEAVQLQGWRLSDDATNPGKWIFPAVELQSGECLVVFASGLDGTDAGGALHANFSLSSEGEQAVLSDAQGRVMDRVDFDLLREDEAWCLGGDGQWSVASPSPGQPNT